jgi:hypothetical protein
MFSRQTVYSNFPSKRAGAVRVDLSSYFKIPGPTNARLLLSSSLPPVSTRARVAPRVARRPAPRPLLGLGPSVEVRSIHWFPYDRVGVVNADP